MINNSLTDFEKQICTIFHNALNALDFAKLILLLALNALGCAKHIGTRIKYTGCTSERAQGTCCFESTFGRCTIW